MLLDFQTGVTKSDSSTAATHSPADSPSEPSVDKQTDLESIDAKLEIVLALCREIVLPSSRCLPSSVPSAASMVANGFVAYDLNYDLADAGTQSECT